MQSQSRGYACLDSTLRRSVDCRHNLIGREVMDHVPSPGDPDELAPGYLLMQPLGLAAYIDHLVVSTRHDPDRHGQLTIVLLQLHYRRGHHHRIFRGGAKLDRAQHQLLRKEPVEVLRHRRGLEHLADGAWQHEPGQQRRHGVAHRIPDLRDGEWRVQGYVQASRGKVVTREKNEAAHEGWRLERESHRDHGAPRVPEHDGPFHTELPEVLLVQGRMGSGRPQLARSRAVAVARPLNDNHPVAFRQAIYETVDGEVLDQGAIAMDEHQRLARPTLDVVQAHTIYAEEAADREVLVLRLACLF